MKIRFTPERLVIAVLISILISIVLFVGLHGFRVSLFPSLIISALVFISVISLIIPKLPTVLDGKMLQNPILSSLWLITGLVSVVMIFRLSIFMMNPSAKQYSLFPGDTWMEQHCCLTAYTESARLVSDGNENIYYPKLYIDRKTEGFNVDLYHYPPTFLLLPLGLRTITDGNFLRIREIWFCLSLMTLITAISLVIYRLEPKGQLRAIGMAPLLLFSMPVLSGLQMSNVQIMIVAISMIAFALFGKQKAAGGILLAMAAVAKIFPGLLLLNLLFRKKWAAAGWAAGFIIFLSLVTLLVVGADPFGAFISYELPRLSSGEAFQRPFSRPFALARNMSPFGIPLKLGQLGVAGMTLETGRIISIIYGVGVLFLIFRSARNKPRTGTEAASVWLSILSFGTLMSPFAPANYVLVTLVWLVCINGEIFKIRSAVLIWLLISVPFFISREASFVMQVLTHIPAQVLAIAVPAIVLWRAGLQPVQVNINENNNGNILLTSPK